MLSNVVQLRKTELQEAFEEVADIKPDVWIVVGMNRQANDLMLVGPSDFNAIDMLGMLEFAKTRINMKDDLPRSYA